MALKIILALIAALLTAPLLAAMPLPSASAQEISIICYDSGGNYFYAVKKDTETCFVYPSEITPDGPGLIYVLAPNGKIIYLNTTASPGVTELSFVAKHVGSYQITTIWDVNEEGHVATGYVTVVHK